MDPLKPQSSAAGAGGLRRRLVVAATGRRTTPSCWSAVHLRQQERPVARRRRRRGTRARRSRDPQANDRVRRRRVRRRRTQHRTHVRPGQRVQPPGAASTSPAASVTPLVTDIPWDVEAFDLSRGRQDGRICRPTKPASRGSTCSTWHAKGYRPVKSLPVGVIGGLEWHRNSQELGFSAGSARAPSDVYSLTVSSGTGHAVDRKRARRPGRLAARPKPRRLRWKTFDGREISGFYYKPGGTLHGQASGHHQHPRRAGGAVAAGLHGAQQLLPQRAGRRHHLPQRARLHRLRQDVRRARQRAEAARIRSRTSARCSTGSRSSPISTPRA